ncbi:MAG: hypothetical protein FWF12_06940 [Betaproteobacteria bacterium]|nr:hypothetical protein [Betaproteobacteria bacterium]
MNDADNSTERKEAQKPKGKRGVRCPMLLDPLYPAEKAVLDMLNTIPSGEKAPFIRELILRGFLAEQGQLK